MQLGIGEGNTKTRAIDFIASIDRSAMQGKQPLDALTNGNPLARREKTNREQGGRKARKPARAWGLHSNCVLSREKFGGHSNGGF